MAEINVNIKNIDYKIDLDDLKRNNPVFSLMKGREFRLKGSDGEFHKLKLNEIFSTALSDENLNQDQINDLYDTFRQIKDLGYEQNTLLTKLSNLFGRKHGKNERIQVQDQLIERKFQLDEMKDGKVPFNYEILKQAVENGYSNKQNIKDILEFQKSIYNNYKTPDQYCELAKFAMDETLMNMIGENKDLKNAYIILESAGESGEVEYLKGKVLREQNKYDEALPHFEKGAEMGNLDAHFMLGQLKSDQEKIDHYVIASEGGHPKAPYYLGLAYLEKADNLTDKEQIEENINKGQEALEKASEQGNERAPFKLGELYYNKKEYKEAVEILEKAIKDLPVRDNKTFEIL